MLTLIEHSNGEEIMKRSYWIVYGLLTGMLIIFWTTSAWAADVIKIGIIGPMEYSYGKNQWNGALMAAEEINNGGGIKVGKERMKVQLIKADSKEYTGVTKAVDAMEQLTKNEGCDFVLGGLTSEATLAMQEVAMNNKTIFFSVGAAHPELCKRVLRDYSRYKYYFRGSPLNSYFLFKNILRQFQSVALLLKKKLPINDFKVAILAEQGIWVEPIIQQFQTVLPKMGMEVTGTWRITPTSTDLSSQLIDIEKSGSHIILTIINGPAGITLGRQYGEMQVPAVVMGVVSQAGTLKYIEKTAGKGNYIMTTANYTLGLEINELTRPFVDGFYKRFGELPQNTANTYGIIRYTIKQTIESAQSLDPERLVPEIEKSITKIPGGIEAYSRDEKGQPDHDLVWGPKQYAGIAAQWQDGNLVAVWPHFKWNSPYWTFSAEPPKNPDEKSYRGIGAFQIAPWILAVYGKKP